jgi:hypothetical protein
MCEHHSVTTSTSAHWTLTRRTALKLALAAGVVSIPAVAGGRLLLESNGRPRPDALVFVAAAADDDATTPLLIAYPDGANSVIWQEILRVEGLPYVRVQPLAALTLDSLHGVAVVIVPPGEVSALQAELLVEYVTAGGGLIVVQPGAELTPLCGLAAGAGVTAHGYLCVQSGAPGAEGIDTGALQFHAPLRHYELREAEQIAVVCSQEAIATTTPAVTWQRIAEGAVVTWCYDLAQSVVLTRQGPPAHAGAETDGVEGVRAVDMFPGFIDLERIHLPQADEQQRLLVNLLDAISAVPLPRLWYFPNNANSVLVLTGDSHNNPALAVDSVLRRVEDYGGTMSIYYTPPPTDTVRRAVRRVRTWLDEQPVVGDLVPPSDVVTPYHAALWRARGHEFALHPYVEEGLELGWARYWQQFTGLGFGTFTTTRTHRVLWHGWTDTARVQAGYAINMNFDYYHVGPIFQRANGSWAFGYFTGSGLPMRFVDVEGRLIDNWQQKHAPGRRTGDRDAVGRQFRWVNARASCRDRQRGDPAGGGGRLRRAVRAVSLRPLRRARPLDGGRRALSRRGVGERAREWAAHSSRRTLAQLHAGARGRPTRGVSSGRCVRRAHLHHPHHRSRCWADAAAPRPK